MSFTEAAVDAISESIDYGVTASANDRPDGHKMLRITDIQNDTVNWMTVPWCDAETKGVKSAELMTGDIVFARTGATTGKSFLIRDCPDGAVFASYLIRVRPKGSLVEPAYLAHFFRSERYWSQIRAKANGAAQPGVNATSLASLQVPLLPIGEQRRIAAILDSADALRVKRRQALAKLDTLVQSIFIDMFGEPTVNGMNWQVVQIGDVLKSASYGTGEKSGPVGRWPVLRMGNLTYGGSLNFSDLKYVDLATKDVDKYLVYAGDVLFNRTNSANLVGKTAVYRSNTPMAYAGYLVRLRTGPRLNPEYLGSFMNLSTTKARLRSMCKSIVGMANINAKEVQSLRITLPPIELQNEFAVRVNVLNEFAKSQQTSLELLNATFASLQQRAFRGEL